MSERTAWTPGPWRVERRWSNGCEIVPRIVCDPDSDRGCGWIADLIGAPYLGHESTLPNAHLIAAAPDLVAACQAALAPNRHARECGWWDHRLEGHSLIHENGVCDCWQSVVKAALAKAGVS